MTHQEYNPERWSVLIDRKIKRDASKYTDNIQASTDMFTCKKCKSKRTTYYEAQIRSADEPATIFITCIDCGKHWKQ
jgi:transcription elongation factor S-II